MGGTASTLVIDASVILAWLLPKERYKQHADSLLHTVTNTPIRMLSPTICSYEVINGIRSAILTKRITLLHGEQLVRDFSKLSIQFIEPTRQQLLTQSHQYNISVYDAAYLTTAQMNNCTLYTLDKKFYYTLKGNFAKVFHLAINHFGNGAS